MIHATNNKKETPLHILAKSHNPRQEIVAALLHAGASTCMALDEDGRTPFMSGLVYHCELMLTLLKQSMDMRGYDLQFFYTLLNACQDVLLQADNHNMYPIHVAAVGTWDSDFSDFATTVANETVERIPACRDDMAGIAALCRSVCVNDAGSTPVIHQICYFGQTPGDEAAIREVFRVVQYAAATEDARENMPLHCLVANFWMPEWVPDVVDMMPRERVLDVGEKRYTPLHCLVRHNADETRVKIARILLSKDASCALKKDRNNATPLHLALSHQNSEHSKDMVAALIESAPDALHMKASQESKTSSAFFYHGMTPLHVAAIADNGSIGDELLQMVLDAWPNAQFERDDTSDQCTPLMLAIILGMPVSRMLPLKESASYLNAFERTPLHEAVLHNYVDAVEFLLRVAPETMHVKDNSGNCPAVYAQDDRVINLLQKACAKSTVE